MKILDKLLARFGYTKDAQVKPSDYPENNKIPLTTKDRDLILVPEEIKDDVVENINNFAPEQISGNPHLLTPDRDIQRVQNEEVSSNFPFNSEINAPGASNNINYPNEQMIDTPFMLDVEDVKKINKSLGQRMETLGIKSVDKELFMKRYNELVKKAILDKKPISEYMDAYFNG